MWYCDKCNKVSITLYRRHRTTTTDYRGSVVIRQNSNVNDKLVSRYVLDCGCSLHKNNEISYYKQLKIVKHKYFKEEYENKDTYNNWVDLLTKPEYNNIREQVLKIVSELKAEHLIKKI